MEIKEIILGMPSIGASTCFHPTWTFGTCLAPCPTNQLDLLPSSPMFFSKNSTTHYRGEGWPCIQLLVAIIAFQVNRWIHHLGRVWWSLIFYHPCILGYRRFFPLLIGIFCYTCSCWNTSYISPFIFFLFLQ